jgi:arabinan endo-1,5-alpha-L-arabinosidase
LVDLGNGYCKIVSMLSENSVVTLDTSQSPDVLDGVSVGYSNYKGTDNQQWKLIEKDGYYGIVSKYSNDKGGLDVYDWSEEDGGIINQWNYWEGDCQLWDITPVYPWVADGNYWIKNVNSGLYLNTDNDGNINQSATPDTYTVSTKYVNGEHISQIQDDMSEYSSVKGDTYQAIGVDGNDGTDGNNISIQAGNPDSVSQQFKLKVTADGSYAVLTGTSDFKSALDVFEISLDESANVCQWDYWGGDGQRWVFIPSYFTAEDIIPPNTSPTEITGAPIEKTEPTTTPTEQTTKTTEPTEKTTSATTPTKDTDVVIDPVMYGDVNGDGKVELADIVELCKAVSAPSASDVLDETGLRNADVFADNIINSTDISVLANAMVNSKLAELPRVMSNE